MTEALAVRTDQTLSTTDIMEDWQIPTVAHGERGRIPRNDPKLLRQPGVIRGSVRGARHKSSTVLKAPKGKTERTERIKFLPPDGAHEVYDPRDYNDRLLLGLKGTLSEAQWYQMRTQLYAALLNRARHSELAIRLPVGYDRGEYEARPEPNTLSAIEDRAEELGRLTWELER